jgi:N-acetylmuramoyl-L-alanine amidase
MASFSNGGRTITITPAPVAVAAPSPGPASSAAETPKAEQPRAAEPPAVPPLPTATPRPRFLVAIDAGHGGDDRGAVIGELAEKDITLALARRLRAELQARGIPTLMLREGDSSIPLDRRAEAVNTARATAYITLHAAGEGQGVRVYTSASLAPPPAAELVPWDAAQARHLAHSRVLADAVAAELARKRRLAGNLPAPVRPLNNVAAAAIVVEMAASGDQPLTSAAYQQSVAAAVAQALEGMQAKLEAAR